MLFVVSRIIKSLFKELVAEQNMDFLTRALRS